MRKKNSLAEISRQIREVFNEEEINKLAYKTGYYRRKGKLNPLEFLSMCVFYCENICTSTLSELCSILKEKYKISISENGLNKRFTEEAEMFLKIFLSKLASKQFQLNNTAIYYQFNRIRIADATGFKLPIKYIEKYPGTGSEKSPASAVKIQLEYDLLTGKYLNYGVYGGTTNDTLYLGTLQEGIRKGDLCIRDLGYYKLSDLKEIDSKNAYFISRLKNYSAVYCRDYKIDKDTKRLVSCDSKEYRRLYIDQIFDSLLPGEIIELKDVQIGNIDKLQCRLIITKLTAEGKGAKEKKLKKDMEKKKIMNSYSTQKFIDISAYITNIEDTVIKAEEVHNFYMLRWQIELMFKSWKSIFKIQQNKTVKIERFHCSLYGTLIRIVLSNILLCDAKQRLYQSEEKVISEYKTFKIIKNALPLIGAAVFKSLSAVRSILEKILGELKSRGKKSKRKKKKLPLEVLETVRITEEPFTGMVS
jgi:Transposase DDE domain